MLLELSPGKYKELNEQNNHVEACWKVRLNLRSDIQDHSCEIRATQISQETACGIQLQFYSRNHRKMEKKKQSWREVTGKSSLAIRETLIKILLDSKIFSKSYLILSWGIMLVYTYI